MVVNAQFGFFENSEPLIDDYHAIVMRRSLNPKIWLTLGDVNHYSILHDPAAIILSATIRAFVQ